MEAIETLKKGNKTLKIFVDSDPQDPRGWDNLSKFVLNHKRYNLPNELKINFDKFGSWEEVYNYLRDEIKAVIIKAVRGYDHGGLSISLSEQYPFNDYWDSGQLGFICILEEDIKKYYDVKEINKDTLKRAEESLRGEFDIYSQYLAGEVYGFTLTKNIKVKVIKQYSGKKKQIINTTEEEELDSCWGFYGDDGIKQIKQENGFK